MPVSPTHAIVAVTDRCNARCAMCDIWQKGGSPELEPAAYGRLPSSLREINVTGGEPLLRSDLAEIIRTMRSRCPRARIVLSTNGLLPSRLERTLAECGDIGVRVSLDGIGEMHNRIRGVENAYDKAVDSLEVCKRAGVKDLGICATMTRENAGVIKDIQDFARTKGIQFTFTVAHSSPVFFGDQRDQEPESGQAIADMEVIRSRLFGSCHPKDWFRAYFVSGLMDVVAGRPRPVECRAGTDFFYLDPQGNIYPCHLWDEVMGNLVDETYAEAVSGHPDLLASVRKCKRRCWMTCTVAPEMRRRLPLYVLRVGWAKLRHHLRTAFGVT